MSPCEVKLFPTLQAFQGRLFAIVIIGIRYESNVFNKSLHVERLRRGQISLELSCLISA